MTRHDPLSRCTPLNEWPERDRVAWAVAVEPAAPLAVAGYALRWKASTRVMIISGYGRWLAWLERMGLLDPKAPPGDRASRDRIQAYLAMLRAAGLADNTVAGRLEQLGNALRAIAPDGDWGRIHLASSRIYSTAKLVRDPVARMQPPEAVIGLGRELMQVADHDSARRPVDQSVLYRDGLIIAFLVHRPFRLDNLAGLSLERHLQRRGGQWRLFIDATDTKGGLSIDCAWPADLVDELERYLSVHRPRLLEAAPAPRGPVQALWVSKRGLGMGEHAIARQVSDRTCEAFGKSINVHTFRHIAATLIATNNPKGASDISAILGHKSMRASDKHYNRAKTIAAGASLQANIALMRKEARTSEAPR
jgi:integrase/recombinase XerD